MKMNDLALESLFIEQIRYLQRKSERAHLALLNWGAYSRHLMIGPGFARSHLCDQHDGDIEGYAEEGEAQAATDAPVKAEAKQADPYDEAPARVLCERLHGPGGIPLDYRLVLKNTYVYNLPEHQLAARSNRISESEFLYRLSEILKFAGRFA